MSTEDPEVVEVAASEEPAPPVMVEPEVVAEPDIAEGAGPDAIEPDAIEPDIIEPDIVELDIIEPSMVEPAVVAKPAMVEPEAVVAPAIVEAAVVAPVVLEPPTITTIEPSVASLAGGVNVTIVGERFAPGCVVFFGATSVEPTSFEATRLVVSAPKASQGGPVDVRVENPNALSEIRVRGFVYEGPLSATRPQPAVVAAGRETSIRLHIEGFRKGCLVRIGDASLAVESTSGDEVTCVVPALAAAVVDIEVIDSYGQSGITPAALRIVDPPSIESVAPSQGLVAGGTSVKVTGTGFSDGSTVTFLGDYAPAIAFLSETEIVFVTPRVDAPKAGSVIVQTPDGLRGEKTEAFTYLAMPPPRVEAITPDHAWVTGTARITLTGADMLSGCVVRVGGAPAQVVHKSDAQIEIGLPAAGQPGAVDIEVENPDGQRIVLAGAFTYERVPAPPKLISVTPNRGFTEGGATLRLMGDNFDAGTIVRIGEVTVIAKVLDPTRLEITLPAREAAGAVAIELSDRSGVVVRVEDAFLYDARPPATIESVAPKSGLAGTKVVIEGELFAPDSVVRFGTERAATTVIRSASRIETVVPMNRAGGIVDVELIAPDGRRAIAAKAFRYEVLPAPSIQSVAPNRGGTGGGTELSVTGKGFVAQSIVLVGGKPAKYVKLTDPTTLECKTPPGDAGKMVDVVVQNPDGKEATSRRAFLYDPRYD